MSDIKWKDYSPGMTFIEGSIWLLAVADEYVVAAFVINHEENNTGCWYQAYGDQEPVDTEPHQIAFIED